MTRCIKLLARGNSVHDQVLSRIREKRLVCPSREQRPQLVDVGFTHHEDVLLSWNSILLIIYDAAVAIEGKPIFQIAANLKYGHRSVGRRDSLEDLCQGAGGVGEIDQGNVALGVGKGGDAEKWAYPEEE